ncbi:sensor histidine kinase [Luteolibacter yonseiensis]|uniref:histidine kinase n=1 Tax=Luteolibacter yonseiensis TaxID=1144680 RepID=A0A934R3F3_9BACT|nr:sensor histidine kinase [Luteolibacter yonseiensis]MBK1814519.1 sensor histidine kinase [Luteolibacter yonseiensis]
MKEELALKDEAKPLPLPGRDAMPWSLPEVRIVIIYFILASAWIVSSDKILTNTVPDETESHFIQSIKGLNFVITTAILLFFVLRRAYRGWRKAERQRLAVIESSREKFHKLSSRIQSLREEERTRIAREIHDELGQLLTGIKMELRLVENRISDRDDPTMNPAIDKLVEISELVDETIASVQRIATGLRPSSLDHLGLGTALLDEAVQFSARSGIPCAIVVEDCPNILPREITTTTFRIFQEALTNVARHAGARHVDARVSVDEDVLKLLIHDDGRGIDPKLVEDPKSLGLIGMLERAVHVGGNVTFTPGPEKGTDVTFTVPLPPNETTPGLPS